MSPHDLRPTAAGILHRAVSEDGAHYFDLLDIQKVLGHANPARTVLSYTSGSSLKSRTKSPGSTVNLASITDDAVKEYRAKPA